MAGLPDGAVVSLGAAEFSWNEDVDDEGRRSGWYSCHRCERTIHGGDDSLAAHECPTACPACEYVPAPDEGELTPEWHRYEGILSVTWPCCGADVLCPGCASPVATAHRYSDEIGAYCTRCPWSAAA
jgi:hypothetical protein